MRNQIHPDTLAQIERAVPTSPPMVALDIWKQSGGPSHASVKNALKLLVQRGRVLQTQRIIAKRPTFHYQRVVR